MNKRRKKSCFLPIVLVLCVTALAFWGISELKEKQEKLMYPIKYSEYVEKYSKEFEVPIEILYAVIKTESGFDPEAKSPAGALGLMQMTPDTYNWLLNKRKEERINELYDPETSIEYGSYFLSYLYNKFGNWNTAFAAYNAGMNAVSGWLEDKRYSDGKELINIPYPETSNYVKKVNNSIIKYRKIYGMDGEVK